MKHEECMKNDIEYKETYEIMLNNEMSLQKIIEVVVKSNNLVGVGIVSLKDGIDAQLIDLMRGY